MRTDAQGVYPRQRNAHRAAGAAYCKKVASALAVAHKASVLHRDVTPDNIVLCSDGKVKLIDFGAARQVVAEYSQNFSVILKHGFAPLEQYHKKGNQGPWTDIYALGATLYFALTGDIPEDPMTRFDDDDTFKENQFGIDPELWSVILKATSLKNEDRYKDAEEMLNDLNKIRLEPQPVFPVEHADKPSAEPRDPASYNYKQHISFSPDPKKTGFFGRRRGALIASAAGLAVVIAAVILASVIGKPPLTENDGDPSSDSPTTQSGEPVFAEIDHTADSETVSPGERVYFADNYKTMVLYSTLDDSLKELYELIYNCVANSDESLELTPRTYDKETVDTVYQRVLYDNPQFYYVESCGMDLDGGADGTEYVGSIKPVYAEVDREAMETEVSEIARICRKDTDINTLCAIHDYMITHTQTLERNSDPLGSSAYGVTMNGAADDIGFAKAYCYYVQQAGFPCYVVEGEYRGEPRAWCRFQMTDDLWYNADVYGDVFADSVVTKMEITRIDDSCFQTFFLTNDEHIQKQGYTLSPEYEYLLTGEYAAENPKENYYFQRNYQYYFRSSPEAVYEFYVPWVVEQYQAGLDTFFSSYMTPFLADGLYDKMNSELLDDLKENYGLEFSGFTMEYTPNCIDITLIE